MLIDQKLLHKAMNATGLKTKRAVVEAGLRALIQSGGYVGARHAAGDMSSDEDIQDIDRKVVAASDQLKPPRVRRRDNG